MKNTFLALLVCISLIFVSCGEEQKTNSSQSEVSKQEQQNSSLEDVSEEQNSDLSSKDNSEEQNTEKDNSKEETGNEVTEELTYNVSYKDSDLKTDYDHSVATTINCNENKIEIKGDGASFENTVITISKGGIYVLSGNLKGQIVVNSTDSENVRLILKGFYAICETSAPLYVKSADKVIITLEENTVNSFKDTKDFNYDDTVNEEPSATIFSKDDLTINGSGSLKVEALFKNGIQCKDKLKICGGNLTINAPNDGLKGKDCVAICDGNINITCGGDGIQSSNTDQGNVGFVNIKNGKIKITSSLDGIQGESGVCISGGNININAGNSSTVSSTESRKGIKGTKNIIITGGKITSNSTDDGIHSDGDVNIEGGEINISSGDDGIHAETEINIKDGTVNIIRSYEGLESAKINILGGKTTIKASDDGVNASDGTGGKGGFGGGMQANSNCYFNVFDGFIYVNAQGDGLDSNGNISISGGTVVCEGPTNGGNSSIDHNGSITITGGTLLSLGSNGMAGEILSSTANTTQCVFGSYCNGNSGTTLAIKDSKGKVLLVFKTSKNFGHLVFSSPNLKTGETYEVFTGGTGYGECINGLYTNNNYEGGTKLVSVTQSDTVTGKGEGFMGGGGGGFPGGGTRPPKPNRW